MVKIMENTIKMDDLGGKKPDFWFNTHIEECKSHAYPMDVDFYGKCR